MDITVLWDEKMKGQLETVCSEVRIPLTTTSTAEVPDV